MVLKLFRILAVLFCLLSLNLATSVYAQSKESLNSEKVEKIGRLIMKIDSLGKDTTGKQAAFKRT